jgi:hypothetical protein
VNYKTDNGPSNVRAEKPGNPRTQYDALSWFGGRKIIDVDGSEIARQLIGRNVPNISHNNGREQNLAAYSQHIEGIGKAAADQAVAQWLAKGVA